MPFPAGVRMKGSMDVFFKKCRLQIFCTCTSSRRRSDSHASYRREPRNAAFAEAIVAAGLVTPSQYKMGKSAGICVCVPLICFLLPCMSMLARATYFPSLTALLSTRYQLHTINAFDPHTPA